MHPFPVWQLLSPLKSVAIEKESIDNGFGDDLQAKQIMEAA
jgi:hypothetical protein